jgi:hypothetical protein
MRPIDADKVIDHLEKVKKESRSLVDVAHIIGFQSVIDAQPTAYDVDKVVSELQDKSFERYGNQGMGGELVISLDDAVEIVKRGGKNE